MMPEFIRIAPAVANATLLFGACAAQKLDHITQFIPGLQVQGFPTTIIVDANNRVRKVISGYKSDQELIDTIFAAVPEIASDPAVRYLRDYKSSKQGGYSSTPSEITPKGPADQVAGSGVLGAFALKGSPATSMAATRRPVHGRHHQSRHPHHQPSQQRPQPDPSTVTAGIAPAAHTIETQRNYLGDGWCVVM